MENVLGLVSDFAYADERGKLFILGEFRYIFAANVPCIHPRLAIAARWEADWITVKDRLVHLTVSFVDQDGNPVLPETPPLPIRFSPIGPAAVGRAQAQAILQLQGLQFPTYGPYAFHFKLDGVHCGKATLHLVQQPPAGAGNVAG